MRNVLNELLNDYLLHNLIIRLCLFAVGSQHSETKQYIFIKKKIFASSTLKMHVFSPF